MPKVAFDDHVLDVAEEAYVTWLVGILIGPLDVVGAIFWFDQTGSPRSVERIASSLTLCITNLKVGLRVIDDAQIRPVANQALRALVGYQRARRHLLDWVEANVSRSAITKHRRDEIETASTNLPTWVSEIGYRQALAKSSREFSRYLDALDELVPVLKSRAAAVGLRAHDQQLRGVGTQMPRLRRIVELGLVEALRIEDAADS
jgi:hypothetical protein